MTPAELVACVVRLHQRAAFADNAIYHENDQKAYEHARAAFHEAGRLLDFCAPKTCGTCAHVLVRPGHGDFGDWLRCGCEYAPAYLADVTYTECCRSWRRKDGAA